MKGSVFVLVLCGDLQISIVLPIDFDYAVEETVGTGNNWKSKLFTYLNEGIVL
ncbi:hypothetical protein GYMLUDRAFT_466130 [Collybiopsis luxurians FD-317 M1]|uniref:Uncharacterized protein n=1 Tax=Collybiopsis luxurians FD-317 M1 TaxID=944289 RepID=A0A0D0BH92_9AGAR|nr:hypothetical protein GYMLUDRAFT_466130 [Collybiopsis luxurians FD-317 M1]